MTAERSPFFIRARRSSSAPSTSLTDEIVPNAPFSWADAGDPSRSANPIERTLFPPEKIDPNRITKISGNASVQNSAARSRVKLRMWAIVRSRRAFIGSVPERPTGQVEEDVFERRPADREIGRFGPEGLGRVEDGSDRRGDVAGIEQDLAVLALDRHDRGHRRELCVLEPVHGVEPDRPLLEVARDELVDRALLEDPAVIHDRDPIAQDL